MAEMLQIETVKHLKIVFAWVWKRSDFGPLDRYQCPMDSDLLDNNLSVEKMGQVEQVEIVFKVNYGSVMKVLEFENLNHTNMSDFISKFIGKQSIFYQ